MTSTRLNGNVQEDLSDFVSPEVSSAAPKSTPPKLNHHGNPDTISRPHMAPDWFITLFDIRNYWGYYCLRDKSQLHKNDTEWALNLGILK